jgi:thioredoxin reductase (NADPH)
MSEEVHNVVIIGSGPAGWTAGLYTARAMLSPILFTGYTFGGQLSLTTEIENYPGLREGVTGPELIEIMRAQAERFGTRVYETEVTKVDLCNHPFTITTADMGDFRSKTVIIATGSSPRRLGLPSEEKFFGRGVSTCATCDGFFFRSKVVAVVGGGDSAMEEAIFLTRFATRVYVIHRRERLRASQIMQQRAFANPKIEFKWNRVVTEVLGDQKVEGVRLRSTVDLTEEILPIDGLFLAIGHEPNTQLFRGQLEIDEYGYLVTDRRQRTNIPGVFAAGDVQDRIYRQAVTAAGTGCAAALEAERFLAEIEQRGYPQK